MKQANGANGGRRKRASKGAGRLYKRDAVGKEHPADWNGAGTFWLAYTVNGRRVRQMLRDARGNGLTDREQAEKERRRITAPIMAGNQTEALRVVQARLRDAETARELAVDQANPPLQIAGGWTAYLRAPERPDSGEVTLTQYEGHWTRFEKWILARHPEIVHLRDVTPATAAEYAMDLTGAKLSGNRINKHVGFLRLAFRVLADTARTAGNPFERIKRKVQRTQSRREFTIPELTTVLDRAADDLGTLLLLGAATGLRLGDCCTLTWNEVDLARRIIRRIPHKTARSGKPVLLGIPPRLHERLSSIRRRTGDVLPGMAAEYQRAPYNITNKVKDHFLDCGLDVHAPGTGNRIKRDADGNPVRDQDGRVITEPTGKDAVVELGFHSLRHTWVSMHAAAGTPGAIVQASVGHANPAMTAHYTHVNEVTARDVARALPVFAGNHTPTRDPLPSWARMLAESLTTENVETVKAALLKEVTA